MPQIHSALEESVGTVGVNGKSNNDVSINDLSKTEDTTKQVTLNVAAAALRRMTQLDASQGPEQDKDMFELVDHLLKTMVHQSDQEQSLTRYALLDILSSLAFLERRRGINQFERKERIRHLSVLVVQKIQQNRDNVLEISSSKLVDTLYAFHVLGFGVSCHGSGTNKFHNSQQSSSSTIADNSIQMEICKKLVQGHYLGKLSPGDMSIVLTTLARGTTLNSEELTLAIGLMRRFRKQAVRQSATTQHLLRALGLAAVIGMPARDKTMSEIENNPSKLYKEAQLMVYTVFKDILQRLASPDDNAPISLNNISNMVSSLASMHVLKASGDDSLQKLWNTFLERQSMDTMSSATVDHVSRFLRAVEASRSVDMALPPHIMQRIGEHFLDKITGLLPQQNTSNQSHKTLKNGGIDPKAANTILRYAALNFGHNADVMKPFQTCAQLLFTNEDFLASSHAPYLTNYMSFLDKAKYHSLEASSMDDKAGDPLVTIGSTILKHDVSDTFTPAQASRILSTFTSISLARIHERGTDADEFNRIIQEENMILLDLFHNLGGHLLTDSSEELSPRDISAALCAYAKASYVQDMGIFDHLAESLAFRVDECSIRQVTQSLWACGKMANWELQQEIQEEESTFSSSQSQAPPYLPSAEDFAAFLSERQDEMTSKDLAQTFWALGRLEGLHSQYDFGSSSVTVSAFLPRAAKLAPHLTSPEIANILWGMSQTGGGDCSSSVQSFTERLLHLHHSVSDDISSQEAASVMLALGRMKIVNEDLFEALSNEILDQLDTASAQTIANALWAYRALYMSPPRQLLDRWAIERLGLNTAKSFELGIDHL